MLTVLIHTLNVQSL